MGRGVATFRFVAEGRREVVWELFGAEKERVWAPDWEPALVFPEEGDREGMVFTIAHPLGDATWVNTRLDAEAAQYVYVIPGVVATRITLRLTEAGERTEVEVTYERTALRPELREKVLELSRADAQAGPEWAAQINGYLRGEPTSRRGR